MKDTNFNFPAWSHGLDGPPGSINLWEARHAHIKISLSTNLKFIELLPAAKFFCTPVSLAGLELP